MGRPYDTLEEVIGIRPSQCSLREYGGLLPPGGFCWRTGPLTMMRSGGHRAEDEAGDDSEIQRICDAPVLLCGADWRLIAFCKACKPDVICMVDNCYANLLNSGSPLMWGGGSDGGEPDQKSRRRACACGRLHLQYGSVVWRGARTGSARRARARRWGPIWG